MQSKERFRPYCAIFLLPIKGNQVLLQRRFNTGYSDGWYSLVAGHVDGNETARQAMIREALEETGVILEPEDLEFIHVLHRRSVQNSNRDDVAKDSFREYIDFVFACETWEGNFEIKEPDKCDELRWVDMDKLPENVLPYIKQAIEGYKNNNFYSEHGWDKDTNKDYGSAYGTTSLKT